MAVYDDQDPANQELHRQASEPLDVKGAVDAAYPGRGLGRRLQRRLAYRNVGKHVNRMADEALKGDRLRPDEAPPRNIDEALDNADPDNPPDDLADDLRNIEDAAANDEPLPTVPSREEELLDKLNKGYTGKAGGKLGRKTLVSRMANNKKSTLIKRMGIAGALVGSFTIGGSLLFLVLLPFKLEHMMANIEAKVAQTAVSAETQQMDKAFNSYLGRYLIPSLFASRCHYTTEPGCVRAHPGCNGIFCTVFGNWLDNHAEYDVASRTGVIVGRDGPNYYVRVATAEDPGSTSGTDPGGRQVGTQEQLDKLKRGEISFFDLDGVRQVDRAEFRKILRDQTKWYQLYRRFMINRVLAKNGVERCLVFCKIKDPLTSKITNKVAAAKVLLLRRMMPEKYGVILSCVIAGASGCKTELDPAKPGDSERLSPLQKQVRESMQEVLSQLAGDDSEKLAKLTAEFADTSKDISKYGLKRYLLGKAVAKVFTKLGGEAAGATAEKTAIRAIPVVGWVVVIAGVIAVVDKLGPMLAQMAYSLNTATAVQLGSTVTTALAECQSGHCDAGVLGGLTTAYGSSISGNPESDVDYTQSPYWQHMMNSGSSTTTTASSGLLGLLLGGTASAEYAGTPSTYRCDDGSAVPAGQYVCPEENFAQDGLQVAQDVSKAVDVVPIIPPIADAITRVADAPGRIIGDVIQKVPGFDTFAGWATNKLTSAAGDQIQWVQNKLVTAPNMDSGARLVDMTIAGNMALNSEQCQIQLGCPVASDQTIADIRNSQLADEQAEFDSLPLFARIFSTTNSNSLVSRMIMNIPMNTANMASSSLLNLLSDPFQKLSTAFSSILSVQPAFAAVQAEPNPFGIIMSAYTPDQIPDDPNGYWTAHCASKYNSETQQLDNSEWLNSQKPDPKTGVAVADKANPCMLLLTTKQIASAIYDTSTLAPNSSTPDQ